MRTAQVSPTLSKRYWSHVDRRGPGECWPWTAYIDRGDGKLEYGKIWAGYTADGKLVMEYAHRVGWLLVHGDPGDQHVRHTCDNPLCQNPTHWVLGSHQQNMNDMNKRGRAVYVRGTRQGQAKLDDDKVRDIRIRRAAGETYAAIAAVHGVHFMTVRDVLKGVTWRHVT